MCLKNTTDFHCHLKREGRKERWCFRDITAWFSISFINLSRDCKWIHSQGLFHYLTTCFHVLGFPSNDLSKRDQLFPHTGMKLQFAFTSTSIKGLIEFIALAERRSSAQVLLASNHREYLSVTSDHNSHLKKWCFSNIWGSTKIKTGHGWEQWVEDLSW